MLNALTIDVEDYFQVSAFEGCVSRECWDSYPLRVEGNTSRILDILDEFGVKATFFVLGWIAERKPGLVREIARRGHEVASHGYGHQRVYNQTRLEFRDDIRSSKALLEDLCGAPVHGYRAPSYSISRACLWAYDELLDAGYGYDSSVFPINHDLYGIPDWPRHPFAVSKTPNGEWEPVGSYSCLQTADHLSLPCDNVCRQMIEIPITTLSIAGKGVPIAGGGYFRLFPYPFTKWGLSRINRVERRSFVFYLHPWEIDPGQPRMSGAGQKSRFRHYLNLHRTEDRFRKLLADFRFAPISEISWFPPISIPIIQGKGCRRPGVGRYVGINSN
jgi:polysaccharide deacetylase family protein (PEP-CTERM system associated)